jgi:hypothetical protein
MRHQTTFHHVVLVRCGVAAAAVAALVGWGASSSAAAGVAPAVNAASTHSVGATRSGTSRSAAGVAIDRRIARDARLRLSDLPPGWTADPTASTPITAAPCPGLSAARAAVSARTASPAFSLSAGDTRNAQSVADLYADTGTAKHWFAEITGRGTRACLVRMLRKALPTALPSSITVGPITDPSLPVAPIGDNDAAFRLTVPLFSADSGMTTNIDVDLVFVRVGRGIAIFSLGGVGSPFDPALETTLVTSVADRFATDLRSAP